MGVYLKVWKYNNFLNILEHCACAISACSQEDQYPQRSACGKISFADG